MLLPPSHSVLPSSSYSASFPQPLTIYIVIQDSQVQLIAMANKVELHIPPSQHVVDVSVINSTTFVRMPLGFFVKDPLPGHENLECPSFLFLVQHPSGKKVLFDLGLRKDTESFPPVIRQGMANLTMHADRDVAQILQEDGKVALDEIDSIIWR